MFVSGMGKTATYIGTPSKKKNVYIYIYIHAHICSRFPGTSPGAFRFKKNGVYERVQS